MEEQPRNIIDIDQETRTRVRKEYYKNLFELNPDAEMKARMWEIDPAIMSELMPEVGSDTFEVPAVPKWKVFAQIALNNIRISVGKWPKETCSPEKRMRYAWEDYQSGQFVEADEESQFKAVTDLIWDSAYKS